MQKVINTVVPKKVSCNLGFWIFNMKSSISNVTIYAKDEKIFSISSEQIDQPMIQKFCFIVR